MRRKQGAKDEGEAVALLGETSSEEDSDTTKDGFLSGILNSFAAKYTVASIGTKILTWLATGKTIALLGAVAVPLLGLATIGTAAYALFKVVKGLGEQRDGVEDAHDHVVKEAGKQFARTDDPEDVKEAIAIARRADKITPSQHDEGGFWHKVGHAIFSSVGLGVKDVGSPQEVLAEFKKLREAEESDDMIKFNKLKEDFVKKYNANPDSYSSSRREAFRLFNEVFPDNPIEEKQKSKPKPINIETESRISDPSRQPHEPKPVADFIAVGGEMYKFRKDDIVAGGTNIVADTEKGLISNKEESPQKDYGKEISDSLTATKNMMKDFFSNTVLKFQEIATKLEAEQKVGEETTNTNINNINNINGGNSSSEKFVFVQPSFVRY